MVDRSKISKIMSEHRLTLSAVGLYTVIAEGDTAIIKASCSENIDAFKELLDADLINAFIVTVK